VGAKDEHATPKMMQVPKIARCNFMLRLLMVLYRLPNALVQLQAHYHHGGEAASESACQLQRSLGSRRREPAGFPDERVDYRPHVNRDRKAYPQRSLTSIDDAEDQKGHHFQAVPKGDSAAFLR
jgi:hypothetical protein